MLSPISFATPAFRGVTIKNNESTKAALNKIPPAYREAVKEDFEGLRDTLDKKMGNNMDLALGLIYTQKPFPYADTLLIDIYKEKNGVLENRPASRTTCYVSTGAPARIPGDIKESFKEVRKSAEKLYGGFKETAADELLEGISLFENDTVFFGRNEEERRKTAESLIELSDTDSICHFLTLPLFLKGVIDKNPAEAGKRYALEFNYKKGNEDSKERSRIEIELIDMEKYLRGDEDPRALLVVGADESCVSKTGETAPESEAKNVLLNASNSMAFYLSI